QKTADSWPNSVDDSKAKEDWDWQPKYDLEKMTEVMLDNLQKKLDV
ncbi:MAG: UDP-glucose 4-epimerase, partial [Candidatus Thermoplasmatota archaeon]